MDTDRLGDLSRALQDALSYGIHSKTIPKENILDLEL